MSLSDSAGRDVSTRIAALDWSRIAASLDADGAALGGQVLNAGECAALRALYQDETNFLSRVVMARHGFGRGEYKYLTYPLPPQVAELRKALWPRLAPLANRWHEAMGLPAGFPPDHADFLARCHSDGQARPTPLILKYGPGDYNCLHQDLYGAHVFPLQAVIHLSDPAEDFTGGELVLTEQRPRMQSRPQVIRPGHGEIVFFAVHQRPVQGSRGTYRVNMRHGVSRVATGERYTLGIIFHDAT